MKSHFYNIENIEGHDVTFVTIEYSDCTNKWVNAYARFENADESKDYQLNEPYVTYQHKKVLGIDTAHSWNEDMTFGEKLDNARNQIKNVICFFKIKEIRKL